MKFIDQTSPEIPAQCPAKRRILNSWKEIAQYIGLSVRTAQRYAARLGLPVHRPAGKDRSSVIAVTYEIDAWLFATPAKFHYGNQCRGFTAILEAARKHLSECPDCRRMRPKDPGFLQREAS